jgi:hypothetical protein
MLITQAIKAPTVLVNYDCVYPTMLRTVQEAIRNGKILFYWPCICPMQDRTEEGIAKGDPSAVFRIDRHVEKRWVCSRITIKEKADQIIEEGYEIQLNIIYLTRIPISLLEEGKEVRKEDLYVPK